MTSSSSQTAAAWLKKFSPLRPTLAIAPGSGFHHALTELRVAKSPLRCGIGWIKIAP
jgi:hypothetical protein